MKEGPIQVMIVGEATEKWMVEEPMKDQMANEIQSDPGDSYEGDNPRWNLSSISGRSQGGNLEMKPGDDESQVASDGSRDQGKFSVTSGCRVAIVSEDSIDYGASEDNG